LIPALKKRFSILVHCFFFFLKLTMTRTNGSGVPGSQAPAVSRDAVFKPSAPVPEGIPTVSGIEFNDYESRSKDITVAEMVSNMTNMGFQAGAVAEAARIINDMVSSPPI